MSVAIRAVDPGSPAHAAGVCAGDELLSIDGHAIEDVLDYRFYMTARSPELCVSTAGVERRLRVKKDEYQDLGLEFDTYLMDKQRACKNKCVFCFIDQLPDGLRDSLYFKDDDARLSFLFGNYITLTNLRERDVQRIVEMRISPVNVSVHTTNPALRVQMMGNPHAGESLCHLKTLASGNIRLNAQLVLCPGLNDGAELERSLRDLCALAPALQSVAVVPVGLTRHRAGLTPLRAFTQPEAAAVIDCIDRHGDRMQQEHGARCCYAADEFYLLAGCPLPDAAHYGDFDQLENGVGLWALLHDEFSHALRLAVGEGHKVRRTVSVATGKAAFPLLRALSDAAQALFPGLTVRVHAIENHFFGPAITVAGLVTGGDLLEQLRGEELGDALLFPAVMLRREGDLFLDGLSVDDISRALNVPVRSVANDGGALLDALLGLDPPA